MPLIIPRSKTVIDEYVVGTEYKVDELFTQFGTTYRVVSDFTGAVQLDYSKTLPLGLGSGDACFTRLRLKNSTNWIKMFEVDTYTTGTAMIGGEWPGQQLQMMVDFETAWQNSRWKIDPNGHAPNSVQQLSCRQPAFGGPMAFWIRIEGIYTPTWDLHVVVNASGRETSPNAKSVRFEPGNIPIYSRTWNDDVSAGHVHNFTVPVVTTASFDSLP